MITTQTTPTPSAANASATEYTWRVRSTSLRNPAKVTTLEPVFQKREGAEKFRDKMQAKFGHWYAYATWSPEMAATCGAADEVVPFGWDAIGAGDEEQITPTDPEQEQEAAREREWQARSAAESKAADRAAWDKFAALDPAARATRGTTDEVDDDGTCRRCAGTGDFVTGTLNGKPTGPGGPCFRCDGKGYQTNADAKRNDYFDRHRRISL